MNEEFTELTPVKKREDVMVWQGLVVPVLLGLTLFFGFSEVVQPLVEAFLLAAGGVVAAFGVEWRAALPLLGGLVKAAFALVAGFGLDLAPNVQVGVLMVVSAVVAYYTQSQVTAKPSQSSLQLAA
jgi:hypothetical protein